MKKDKLYYKEVHNLQLTSTNDNYFMYGYLKALQVKSVFEFGCNAGRHLLQFEKLGIKSFGIDLSERAIKHAKENNLKVKCKDESYLQLLHDSSYEAVITVSVLNHIKDIEEILNELKRISSKYIVICENNTKTNKGTVAPWYVHNYKKHGFEPIREYISTIDNETPYIMYLWKK